MGSFDARYTYHTDHLGSVRFITDAVGTVINAYDYDSYGNALSVTQGFDQPFRYTGREWDEAAQLYHYRARSYDPSTGRFLQEDPIWFGAGDLNIYRYVGSNPVGYTDPSGLSAALAVAGHAQAVYEGFSPIADGIKCKFLGIASALTAIDVKEQARGNLVQSIKVDTTSSCEAEVTRKLTFSALDPTPENLQKEVKDISVSMLKGFAFDFLESKIPGNPPRLIIFPGGFKKSIFRGR